ncbi:MAG: valine--tRNA ligase [Candidatus Saccharimonadales bacterium]
MNPINSQKTGIIGNMKLAATYDAGAHEPGIYKLWEESRVFIANPLSHKPHYSIAMPPPNETGTLHIGHAMGIALQDILARHSRMKGMDVLWLPGTDHAALPTNAIVERTLAEEGTDKHKIGREEFLRRTREYVGNSRDTINHQIRTMGASVDWTRARYTLDASLTRCVNEVFVKMYNDNLIYRDYRIVNWDPKLETNVSDDEVEYVQQKGKLYTFKYGPFHISTARPETKFLDKYVVMHPDDKRYKEYKDGQQLDVEWINGKVKATIIKDDIVDPNFGTGVMTITPAHSLVDFELAQKRNLHKEQIIDFSGKLLPIAGEFSGLSIEEARPKIVDKLKAKGLLVSVDDNYLHNVAVNSRGKGIIEPQIRLQWFIDVNKPAVQWKGQKLSFKQVMQAVIKDGDIKITPSRFEKIYFNWVDNLRDWCISRQIWWGHQIPVWYKKGSKQQIYVGILPPKDETNWDQDPDTLDTWFSSALWTWSTLIDPKLVANYNLTIKDLLADSIDFQTYHPTSVMETGWDILLFWVTKMIMATTYMTNQVPFKSVYLHGLVLTEQGSKMSKSNPDTIIDPLEVIPEYGTDALRLALIQGVTAGSNQRLGKSKIITNRNFCNKLWNVARYIEGVTSDAKDQQLELVNSYDHWIIKQLILAKDQINTDLDHYRFSNAYSKLYHFLWDDLADWYIEASKVSPNQPLLIYVLKNFLIVAHPLAPFVTEAIWQKLMDDGSLLTAQKYARLISHDESKAKEFEKLKLVISETRRILHGLGARNITMSYLEDELIDKNRTLIKQMASLIDVKQVKIGKGIKLTGTAFDLWLDIDPQQTANYLKKLEANIKQTLEHLTKLNNRLANKAYIQNAPDDLVSETKNQLEEYRTKLSQLEAEIKLFRSL